MVRNELIKYMEQQLEKVEASPKIKEAMSYTLISNGKLIRPLIFLNNIKEHGYDYKNYLNVAMAIECIHVYSLVHDDLPAMDNDDFRRGRKTCHKEFGEDIAILCGDSLLTYAFELLTMTNLESEKVLTMVKWTSKLAGVNNGMIEGQVIDVIGAIDNLEILSKMHILKTARLIQLPLILSAIIIDTDVDNSYAIGELVGKIYQINDDYLDKYGSEELIGKPIGSDEIANKTTYLSYYSKEQLEVLLMNLKEELTQTLKGSAIKEGLKQMLIELSIREK